MEKSCIDKISKIFCTIKFYASKLVLGVDASAGITFLFALICSSFLGYLIYCLYEVPIKDVQIYAHKVMGGEKKYGSVLEINLDYGLGVTKKYRKDFERGITLHIITKDSIKTKDSCQNRIEKSQPYFWRHNNKDSTIVFKYDSVKIKNDLCDSLKAGPYNTDICNSVFSIFAITLIESKSPHDNGSYKRETSFKAIDEKIPHCKNCSDSILSRYIERRSYSEFVDTLSGLESICSKCYVALADTFPLPIDLDNSKKLTKPSIKSLYDISQSYFKFTIDIPTEIDKGALVFDFGGAIELSNIYPEPDSLAMSGMIYTSLSKIEYIRNRGLWFHAKFKQMENIQILRMFILTTLLGFFVALLFTSGWKCLIRICKNCVSKKEKDSENPVLKETHAPEETGVGDIENNMTLTSDRANEEKFKNLKM